MSNPDLQAAAKGQEEFKDRAWVGAVLVLVLTSLIRFRFLQVPLERDEGEFAYVGQLILKGVPPYSDACNMKFPGAYYLYAGVMGVFGQTVAGIHLGLWLANTVAAILVYRLGRRFLDGPSSAVACAVFALMTLSPTLQGTSAHATQFLLPFVLGGFLLLLDGKGRTSRAKLLTSGALFSLAIIVKQHAVLFALFALLLVLLGWSRPEGGGFRSRVREALILCAGLAAPLLLMGLGLAWAGLFPKFWFWTVIYAREYVTILSLRQGLATFFIAAPRALAYWGWVLAGAFGGGVALMADRTLAPSRAILLTFFVFSFLSVCPGFYFRPHYFITLVPALALLVGCASQSMASLLARQLSFRHGGLAAFGAVVVIPLHVLGVVFFEADSYILSRVTYTEGCFPEMMAIGKQLRARMAPGDKLGILGSEPELYFYANCRAATGYLYTYPLMESQPIATWMQEDFCAQLEAGNPKFVVMVQNNNSWMAGPRSNRSLFPRLEKWMSGRYRIIGTVESAPNARDFEEHWGPEAATHVFKAPFRMVVLQLIQGG